MGSLKQLKRFYNALGNDKIRARSLQIGEKLNMKKDVLRLDTNNLCNIECVMCSNRAHRIKDKNIMPLEDYKTLIDFFVKSTRLLYLSCQWEPLATPGFERYMEYAKGKGIPFVSFCTNGLLLNDKIIQSLVDHKIDEIIVSINGYEEDDYNRIMAKSNFNRVMENLQKLAAYKREYSCQYPKIRINSLMMKSNLLKFDKFVDLVHKCDIQFVQFRELRVGDNQNNNHEVENEIISNIPQDELKQHLYNMLEEIQMLKKEGREFMIPKWLFGDRIIDRKQTINKKGCCTPFFSYWIEYNGLIKSCLCDNNAIIGNFFEDDIKTIMQNRNIFRKKALENKCASSRCTQNIDSSEII